MKIDGLNNVTGGYQGQGSSVSTTQTQSASASADARTATQDAKQPVITESSDNVREASDNDGKMVIREEGQASNEQIRQSVEKINKNMSNSEAIFGVHEATNRVMIKIVDKDTKEVIKEFPPEKTLDMIAKVWEMAGIMVDEKR